MAQARLAGARTYYSPDWVMPNGWGTGLNFTTPRFEQFAAWVADMQEIGMPVVLNAGWWFTQNSCSVGAPSSCTPNDTSLQVYTEWISETVRELVVTRGFTNVDTLLLFTEPLSYTAGIVPANYTQQTYYFYVIRQLHNKMVADGTRSLVKFHGPNDGGLSSPSMVTALANTIDTIGDILDIYTSHDYDRPDYQSWFSMFQSATNLTAPTGKPFWVDEGGAGPEATRNGSDYGTYLAIWQAALMNAGASNSFLWLWQDQYYVWPLENVTNSDSFQNGLQRWGLQYWLPDSSGVRPAYCAYTIMTRFLRAPEGASYVSTVPVTGVTPGSVVAAAITGTEASGRPDYRAILIVNEGTTPVNVTIAIESGSPAIMSRYAYDPVNPPTGPGLVGPSASVPGSSAQITDTLPARGMAVWASPYGSC